MNTNLITYNKKVELVKEVISKNKLKEIYHSSPEFQICEVLNNGCFIGTLGFSETNIHILQKLLDSFAEQYGEIIDYNAAKEELELYQNEGKLFILFDQDMIPRAMNGCIYNYQNDTVDFVKTDCSEKEATNIYFYGLSTEKSYRGKGYCKVLVDYSIEFAKANNFDLVYARTDLNNSNSEHLMAKAGLEICKYDGDIIAEWVQVTDEYGDERLHMWMPLNENIVTMPKEDAIFAKETIDENNNTYRKLDMNTKVKVLTKINEKTA